MNKQLEAYARKTLKEDLAKCTEDQQIIFKRLYFPENLKTPINDVVDRMPIDRLSWAMEQVERTLGKNND